MTPELFSLAVLESLADIRTALWSLSAVGGVVAGSILAHAVLTRRPR